MKFDASQKGTVIQSVIQYALLASNPSHPQIAGERVGKFIVVILDLIIYNYNNYKLMVDTKNYWQQNNENYKMTDYKMTDYSISKKYWLQNKKTTKKDYKKKKTKKKDYKKRLQIKIHYK